MKQDINLLGTTSVSDLSRPKARQLAAGLVVLLVGAASIVTHAKIVEHAAERQQRALNASIDELVFTLDERSRFLAERDANPTLLGELKRREREAEDKSRVLNVLEGEAVGNTDGFSEYLEAFGRRHPDGLWLTRIRIADGGTRLDLLGKALDADLVPEFLRELTHEPQLAGATFTALKLARDESGPRPLSFALTTDCEPANAAGGEDCEPIELKEAEQ